MSAHTPRVRYTDTAPSTTSVGQSADVCDGYPPSHFLCEVSAQSTSKEYKGQMIYIVIFGFVVTST